MEFYQSINPFYDFIFPLNNKQVDFTCEEVLSGKILDMGCATGSLAIALAEKGFEVTAIDLDQGMIDQAKRKDPLNKIHFREGDMLKILEYFPVTSFNGITCYGNTLAHLTEPKHIGSFFVSAFQLLQKEGKILIQVLNYESLLKTKPEKLPLIENETIRFERSYNYRPDGLINFVTRLTVKETNQVIENSVTLYPVTRYEIADLLEKSGFTAVEFFGGFDRSPVLPSNLPLVVRALKR
ncbi:MAG TPA: methyltransferase domain-containing protein [Prolixibacteraceae bacterium]|nr:methyltransferase domain-containing protein [Prolixibacteraceae bacterium]HPS11735.1 methyltransferase domain-containing protein [Prolixibacteraceae bacterium]